MLKKNKIKIKVNGKFLKIDKNLSIKKLINKLKIPIKFVAIELNNEIINKKTISKKIIKKDDKIEIVHFIGGG